MSPEAITSMLRPTRAEVDLEALRGNYRKISKLSPGTDIMPVVKANAYGHGAVEAASVFQEEGAAMLGVATIEEGIELRSASIDIPILVLGSVYPLENFSVMIRHRLTPIIASRSAAAALDSAASDAGSRINYHFKIDTGMGRIGVSPETALAMWDELGSFSNISCEGIFTHLACADEESCFTAEQLQSFVRLLERIRPPRYIHASNTAGILSHREARFNLVRPGLALYGLYPCGADAQQLTFEPALTWKTAVVFLKEVPSGAGISYGRTWKANKKAKIATLCVGYADGYRRALSNRGRVLIRGESCPVAGRVCMDMIMVDVTGVEGVRVGDEAVLIGASGGSRITAEEVALSAQTINYEIVTGISGRVPRIYSGRRED